MSATQSKSMSYLSMTEGTFKKIKEPGVTNKLSVKLPLELNLVNHQMTVKVSL